MSRDRFLQALPKRVSYISGACYEFVSLDETLMGIAKSGKDWQRVETNVPGLFLVRAPETKTRPPSVIIELNPVGSNGKPMKRKGLFISKPEILEAFRSLLASDKIDVLLEAIVRVFFADDQETDGTGPKRVEI